MNRNNRDKHDMAEHTVCIFRCPTPNGFSSRKDPKNCQQCEYSICSTTHKYDHKCSQAECWVVQYIANHMLYWFSIRPQFILTSLFIFPPAIWAIFALVWQNYDYFHSVISFSLPYINGNFCQWTNLYEQCWLGKLNKMLILNFILCIYCYSLALSLSLSISLSGFHSPIDHIHTQHDSRLAWIPNWMRKWKFTIW